MTLARNDVIGELAGSHSLDVFNEPCTAIIVKKKNWHAKFLYATHLIVGAPTWLKWFNI